MGFAAVTTGVYEHADVGRFVVARINRSTERASCESGDLAVKITMTVDELRELISTGRLRYVHPLVTTMRRLQAREEHLKRKGW